MKKMTKNEKQLLKSSVLELLKNNVDGGYITSADIIKSVPQINVGSKLRAIINELRIEQEPIISGYRGYKYSEDVVEIIIYSMSLRNRINNMIAAHKGLVSKLNNMEIPKNIPNFI